MAPVVESVLELTFMVVFSGALWVWEVMAGVRLALLLLSRGWSSLIYRVIAQQHNHVASDVLKLAAGHEEISQKHEALALAVRMLSARFEEMSDRDKEIDPED